MESQLVIVLSHPEESGNVGAVCRAMANCGVTDLRVIGRREDYDDETVRRRAIHAADVWERAQFFDAITDAVKDCAMSFGTTRRRGKNRKGKLLFPEEFAARAAKNGGMNAVVFGCERTGLTDAELSECAAGITIPASEQFPSYNLSHAVQIVCYAAYRAGLCGASGARPSGISPITLERVEKTVSVIVDKLADIGFFSVTGRPDMARFWRDVLARASLTENEAAYIEKIFAKAAGFASRSQFTHYAAKSGGGAIRRR